MARHWYLDHLGELRQRKTDWRLVGALVASAIVGVLAAVGVVAIVFLITGATI